MTDNDALARGTFSSSIADVLELARRDIARTQTDFLGRMNACLMDYEGICDEHPDGDFGHDRQEADDAISGLAGLALAQLMMLRGEDEPLDPPAQDDALKIILEWTAMTLETTDPDNPDSHYNDHSREAAESIAFDNRRAAVKAAWLTLEVKS